MAGLPRTLGVPGYPKSGGGSSAVTSVDLTVPAGFTVAGGPITTSGTFNVEFASGYQGYTSAEAGKLAGIATGATANQTDAYLLNRANHTGTQPQSTITNLTTDLAARLLLSGGTMTGPLTLSADPASALQAATKQYVDGLLLNMGRRSRVRVATTGNITISTALNSGDVIDGVTLENGDLVLVKDQTTASQNGVYVVSASPARSIEFDAWDEFPGALIGVAEGTSNDNTLWFCTSNTGGTLGTTSITFTQFRVAGELLAANNLSDLANAVTARTNLGLTIGSQVQAWSQKLTDIAGSTPALGDILVWNGTNFVPQAPSGGGMSLPGGMTKDPRLLPLFDSTNSVSVLISGTATNPDVNGFWDGIASRGAVANTATDNNFTTIVNITSGRGLLFNVIPPRHTNLNDVVTFRLTVDGEVYSITRSGPWAISNQYGRVILGQLLDQNSDPLSSSPTNPFLQSPASTTYFNTGSAGTLPKPPYMMALGMPMLLFEESLKVEVMCSDVFPTLNGPKSGVVYTLMG